MDKFSPEGIYSAMMTPFNDEGKVDLGKVKEIIEFLVEKKANGVFPVSNVGEFLILNQQDKKDIIKTVMETSRGRIKVIPGISDLSIGRCLDLANFCAEVGADGVVLCAPYYYPYAQDYIVKFILAVADKSPLPITFYNSPVFANKVEFENLIKICSHENVTAVKESSGDVKFLMKLITELEDRNINTNVLLGWEELLYTGLTLGAKGCITSSGGIVPEILVKVFEYYNQGNMKEALRHEKAVVRIAEEIKKIGFPYGYKLAASARGLNFNLLCGKEFEAEEKELNTHLEPMKKFIDSELSKLELL